MTQKPSIPKGTRDFSTTEVQKRNFIFSTIKTVFTLYGYNPIETPVLENLSTLMGKYGEEGDRLLFKVLNSGDYSRNLTESDLKNPSKICDKGLRYDLTVPFARYVVQHRNEITFPFRRYQIAPVWRADRPQKGRYREFYQCDVDAIGSKSLLLETEMIEIVSRVFSELKINAVLKINNRKILSAIASTIGHPDSLVDIAVAIDKLDKIGLDGVTKELLEKGISQSAVDKLFPILTISGSNDEKLTAISNIVGDCEGITELSTLFSYLNTLQLPLPVELDLSLARGLNYYTGAIFEVKALDFEIGSICGGGRYDNLTEVFGMKDTSGVGISFGAERIFDIMETGCLFPSGVASGAKALFVNFGGEDEITSLQLVNKLRDAGISAELYPTADKLKKQFDYAEKSNIPYMIFIGESERMCNTLTIKDLSTGEQSTLPLNDIIPLLLG